MSKPALKDVSKTVQERTEELAMTTKTVSPDSQAILRSGIIMMQSAQKDLQIAILQAKLKDGIPLEYDVNLNTMTWTPPEVK